MQDAPDPNENTEAAEDKQSPTALAPLAVDSTSAFDSTEPSTVLAEMLPGIAVVFGKVPAELESSLLDFGLVSAAVDRDFGLTGENMVIGTPDYIAPEQATDARTDSGLHSTDRNLKNL